ncbi:MAG: RDD family protein [Rickettsiales bacterium]
MNNSSPVYAPVLFRLGAWIADSFVISAVAALLSFGATAFGSPFSLLTDMTVSYVVQLAYYTYFVAGAMQTSPWGKLFGIKVVDAATLVPPTLWQSYVRIASQIVLVAFIYKIGVPLDALTGDAANALTEQEKNAVATAGLAVAAWYLPALFTERRTAFHDLISGTRVVRFRRGAV